MSFQPSDATSFEYTSYQLDTQEGRLELNYTLLTAAKDPSFH